jgi:hypothetical protein
MSDHVRTQIRKAITAALTGLTTAGDRVFESYPHPLQDKDLPGLKIDTVLPGQINPGSMGGKARLLERQLLVSVTACVKQNAGYQDVVDAMLFEAEVALANDNTLGGLCKWIRPFTEPGFDTAPGERTSQAATQVFEVVYVTALNAPNVPR